MADENPRIDITFDPTFKYRGVRPNPLRNYASSTYNVKLGFMTPDIYRSFVSSKRYEATEKDILISSGGMPRESRHRYFDVDFYIEDLNIDSVIGLNYHTRLANATNINFRIVEPNGFTFFNRIYFLCREIGIENYLTIPYFLKIRFQGWDDIENSHTFKSQSPDFLIPIMFTQVKASVNTSGSEYYVEAVPYNDSALHDRIVTVKGENTITGSNVLECLLDLSQAINTWNKETNSKLAGIKPEQTGSEFYNTVRFEIDEEIALGQFLGDSISSTATSSNDPRDGFVIPEAVSKSVALDRVSYRVSDGSNIVDIVDNIVKTSTYITNQQIDTAALAEILKLPPSRERDNKIIELRVRAKMPLKWYKLRPEIRLKSYNQITRQYAKEIIFKLKIYEIYNGKDLNYPGWGEGLPVKRYNYIFTGKNEDILDFSVKFDNLYYLIVIANAGKNQLTSGLGDSAATRASSEKTENETLTILPGWNSGAPGPWTLPAEAMVVDSTRKAYTSGEPKKVQQAAALSTNIVPNATGDNIEIELEIIGDPEFLVGYNENDFVAANKKVREKIRLDYENRNLQQTQVDLDTLENLPSLSSLETEINCFISFKTPQDYDPETGLMLNSGDPGYIESTFDGVYKITRVKSQLSSGNFKQTLSCIRLPNQTVDFLIYRKTEELVQSQNSDTQRTRKMSAGEKTSAEIKDSGPDLPSPG